MFARSEVFRTRPEREAAEPATRRSLDGKLYTCLHAHCAPACSSSTVMFCGWNTPFCPPWYVQSLMRILPSAWSSLYSGVEGIGAALEKRGESIEPLVDHI